MTKRILMLALLLAGLLAVQTTTTYTIPAGTTCNSRIESCSYQNLTATAPDGSALWGLFGAGGYYTQFDYQAYKGQNPGYKAQYCNGTRVWTVASIDSTHNEYTMDCNASGNDGLAQIHVVIDAHSFVVTSHAVARSDTSAI